MELQLILVSRFLYSNEVHYRAVAKICENGEILIYFAFAVAFVKTTNERDRLNGEL